MEFLTTNDKLSTYQSGNKVMHSTETALINVTDNIFKAIDEKSASLLVLLDMSKAFDSLKHKISCLIATCPLDIKEYDTKIHSQNCYPQQMEYLRDQSQVLCLLLFTEVI